jgi:hypothetical protein
MEHMGGTGEPYECAVCHGTFTKSRSDEEALAEMESTWRPDGDGELATVCDDCFQRVMAWAESDAPGTLR